MEELFSEAVVQSSEFFLDTYSPSRTKCRVILLIVYIFIAGFDSISDLIAWGSFLKVGFGHPLLPTPVLWSVMWGLFAVAGLLVAMVSTCHEVMKMFHLKGSFCKSRVELIPLVGLLLEDVPMLVLAFLYGLSQYTCSSPAITESSDALVPILISSIATALATSWRLILTLMKFKKNNSRKVDGTSAIIQKNVYTHRIKRVCRLKCLIRCCYKTFLFLLSLAICILSVLVVVAVTYLMVQKNPYFIHRPHDPLMVFTPYPTPQALANVSTLIDSKRMSILHENHCLLVLQYRASQHKVVYNFADTGRENDNSSQCNVGVSAIQCQKQLSDLFYGSYRNISGTTSGDTEIFHETCLAVFVVLPRVAAKPEWDTGLDVKCV